MRPDLAAVAARQHGLFTRRQALVAGYTDQEIRRHVRTGAWVPVRRGVYVLPEVWDGVDPYDGRARLRDRAAHLTLRVPHVLSHDSAARAHGLPMLTPRRELVHITRPGVGGGRTEHGVQHHLSYALPELDEVDGLHVTGVGRTALDLGREHGFTAGVVACDGAMRRGVTRGQLEAQLATMTCWPGITASREAVLHADPGAESIGESLSRLMLEELGLGVVDTQFPLRTAGGTFWCDLRIGRHVFEFDGRVKYVRVEQGGVADRDPGEVVWEEKKRERLIVAEGLGISRIIWDDLWGPARDRAKQRLRAEYALTVDRFGTVLPPHLAAVARELRGARLA
ncbi:hypothetical protein EKO23_08465 [Nocardioides guangzhouensis]|uniref:AbiEi antitoxin N-terminal domain-containing protein n=1 Tax=Nocardioides guangzhouensis TaxID=2497878 RepID=A0A4V1XZG7_9ACTN|nr:type IV toxin-antitoxin system AbiEi family antitoxin domain-containing protein [Nocardioides guangzhouensis]RYP86689.1 hypothetical protein EKO23_08465 [Nocardioides guangzhouensis]